MNEEAYAAAVEALKKVSEILDGSRSAMADTHTELSALKELEAQVTHYMEDNHRLRAENERLKIELDRRVHTLRRIKSTHINRGKQLLIEVQEELDYIDAEKMRMQRELADARADNELLQKALVRSESELAEKVEKGGADRHKDEHTEHCCAICGCKYGEDDSYCRFCCDFWRHEMHELLC